MRHNTTLALTGLSITTIAAHADVITIDFNTGVNGQPLTNGQIITGPEVSNLFNLSSSGKNSGLAIFNTDPNGPNAASRDPDLLAGLGNALILQENRYDDISTPGFFDTPNDDGNGGTITFDFYEPTSLISLALIDIDRGARTQLFLTDANGNERNFNVPARWTYEPGTPCAAGYGVIDLATLAPQEGETGRNATAEDVGDFSLDQVVSLEVRFHGSAALDNLTFRSPNIVIPAPGAITIAAAAGFACLRRRRA